MPIGITQFTQEMDQNVFHNDRVSLNPFGLIRQIYSYQWEKLQS